MSAARNAVRVTIGGEEYTVRSELPPEYTREVAAYLDAALKRVRQCDDEGNALSGLVHALESRDNVVHADGNAVVLYGVRDLVVVTRDGLTLVTTLDKASDLKTLIQSLPTALRDQQ